MAMADILLALVPLFVVVDPLASIGLYLGLTQRNTASERNAIAVKAALFAACVLLVFAFLGRQLLDYLGIELYSLQAQFGQTPTKTGGLQVRQAQSGILGTQRTQDAQGFRVAAGGASQLRVIHGARHSKSAESGEIR